MNANTNSKHVSTSLFGNLLIAALACLFVAAALADDKPPARPAGSTDGEARATGVETFVVWDAEAKQWLDPVAFWRAYAKRSGGLTWGASSDYPPYDKVSEHDTLLVETSSGPCLMEFFHRRWRRANDVRRWNERFNKFGGCPDVFR